MINQIPAPREPFIDGSTGLISRSWYMFLLNMLVIQGGGNSDLSVLDLAKSPINHQGPEPVNLLEPINHQGPEVDSLLSVIVAKYDSLATDIQSLLLQPVYIPSSSSSSGPPFSISVGVSPYTYTATQSLDVIVSGGGVSQLEFSRDGITFYTTGSFYGMFQLAVNDLLRVTYSTAPTMIGVPR